MSDEPLRLYAVFSRESLAQMKGIRGKLAAQAGHAYLHAFWNAEARFEDDASAYRNSARAYKIGLVVDTTEELRAIYEKMAPICGATLVEDAGLTVFEGPTVTAVGLGPIRRSLLEQHCPGLRPLS